MTFNPQKCEFLRITNRFCTTSYYIPNCLINNVPHTKYLGVTIDHKLSWNEFEHIQRIVNKAIQS